MLLEIVSPSQVFGTILQLQFFFHNFFGFDAGDNFGGRASEVIAQFEGPEGNTTCERCEWKDPKFQKDATLEHPFIECTMPQINVGYHNLSIKVAGQWITADRPGGTRPRNLDDCIGCAGESSGPCKNLDNSVCYSHQEGVTRSQDGIISTDMTGEPVCPAGTVSCAEGRPLWRR